MTYPVDVYSVGSGQSIYGGTFNRPSWRRAMAANTWAQVPGNTLASINPESNAAVNPNYPGNAPWHGITGFAAIISAWNGAAWDEATATFWMPLQGGHGDYAGNEPYKKLMMSDTPTWAMLRNPSGAVGNAIVLDDGLEASGVYADGRIRVGHAYNNNVYVPGVGPMVVRIKGPFKSGATDFRKAYLVNETTGEPSLFCDLTSVNPGESYGGATYDSIRNRVLSIGVGNTPLVAIDVTTKVPSVVVSSDNYVGQYARPVHVADYDLLAILHNGGAGYPQWFYFFDTANGNAKIQPTITGSLPAGLDANGQCGMCWDSANKRFLLWNNSSNTTQIGTLSPTGNPRTQPWQAGALPVSGANTVTPTAATGTGTYGRFVYSKKLGGCFVLNAVDQPIYFFATE